MVDQISIKTKIDLTALPKHIAIIMDGNGRWAKQRSKPRVFGHQHGVKAVRETTEAAAELGIQFLTLYAFSTENWNRPKTEVDALMKLLVKTIHKETKTLMENNVRLAAIGKIHSLDERCYMALMEAIRKTSANKGMTLILALSYSSHWEIIETTKKIVNKVTNGEINIKEINTDLFSSLLTTAPYPNPELLIRTSGEYRLSNFLLWQMAYSELYFTKKLWPDFRKEDLYAAIADFQKRERRFGMISEQIK